MVQNFNPLSRNGIKFRNIIPKSVFEIFPLPPCPFVKRCVKMKDMGTVQQFVPCPHVNRCGSAYGHENWNYHFSAFDKTFFMNARKRHSQTRQPGKHKLQNAVNGVNGNLKTYVHLCPCPTLSLYNHWRDKRKRRHW